MKKNNIKLKVTLDQIYNAKIINAWSLFCEKYNYNRNCFKNGINRKTKVMITLKDAEDWSLFEN